MPDIEKKGRFTVLANGNVTIDDVAFITQDTNVVSVGQNAGDGITGSNNAAHGVNALTALTSGFSCVGVGFNAGAAIITNGNLTAVGANSLMSATGGTNTALGASALTALTTGTGNTGLGFNAGSSLATSDSDNICIGNTGTAGDNGIIRIGTSGTHTTTRLVDSVIMTGSGTGSGTFALTVENSANNDIFACRDDQSVLVTNLAGNNGSGSVTDITISSGAHINTNNRIIYNVDSLDIGNNHLVTADNTLSITLTTGAPASSGTNTFYLYGTDAAAGNTVPTIRTENGTIILLYEVNTYTRNATVVEDRTLLASASATATNNNNVLAALIADLDTLGFVATA